MSTKQIAKAIHENVDNRQARTITDAEFCANQKRLWGLAQTSDRKNTLVCEELARLASEVTA